MERESGNVTPHPAGLQGKLTTSDGSELPVRTFERGGDVALVVLVDLDEGLDPEQLGTAVLEYNSTRGVVRLRGEAILEDRSLLRFQAQDDAEVTQRREFVRVHTPQAVTLKSSDPGDSEPESHLRLVDPEHHAYTVDLSGGGMLVAGAFGLSAGDTINFSMQTGPGEAPIAGAARVVRVLEDGKLALVFEQIEEAERQRLIRFVFECMRNARARTRANWI
jgi:hypothetical protein